MLSHLRFHRRGGASNPTSPCPDQTPASPPGNSNSHSNSNSNQALHLPLEADRRPASSSSSALPPTLPPITRVTSAETEPVLEAQRDGDMVSLPESRSHQPARSPYNGDSGFLGGVALRKYRRDKEAQAAETTDSSKGPGSDSNSSKSRPSLAPLQTPAPIRPPAQKAVTTSFSTPTDLQNSSSGPTGRRPAGTRLASDPPLLTPTTTNLEKPKKGLPFLKNPMSTLLMRRKTSQHVPDLLPLPLRRDEEPMYVPIKGTRVHDFSAPRRKTTVNKTIPYGPPTTAPPAVPQQDIPSQYLTASKQTARVPTSIHSQRSNAAESLHSSTSQLLKHAPSSTSDTQAPKDAALPSTPDAPPVPPKDEDLVDPAHPRVSQVSRLIDDVDATLSSSTGSTKGGRSRQASLSGMSMKEIPTAVPRHMKSTSSRFSFDMIGAAGQEKLLEERHRQRELEKQTADVPTERDSRYDDFDDDFDYDAMMDDDGLEEPIPMANDDYEADAYLEEEINMVGDDVDEAIDDPDNDQENFSGFVFQRSNPTSSLTSPRSAGFLPTPRDADGKVIGFAMSKDTPGLLSPDLYANTWQNNSEVQAAGLGIQGLDVSNSTMRSKNAAAFQQNQALPPVEEAQPPKEDDLYFDDGMIAFENAEFAEDLAAPPEWDEAPFDESIFDNNDTDQFGRPVPGAFAQAQSQRRAAIEDAVRRESDLTSRLSAHSAGSPSTAHTSLSVDNRKNGRSDEQTDPCQESSQEDTSAASKVPSPNEINMVAYQAALAAAAHKAAASGKFDRGSSPVLDDSFMSEDAHLHDAPFDDSYGNGGYDDYGYENMADFEADDDDIVAEANASALANDSDGWYGQEFGFYSAPVQQGLSHNSSSSSVDYEYANGGFFGPKGGLDRSTSGRMVSREPNLTPITERSEYSNRNSIMSMGLPGFGSGTPLQSPGLAQLALLGDRGDEMSLSALLKLRSRAWGGSQISLVSSREGSPRSERGDHPSSPWGPTYFSPIATHARKNSVLSTFTADSEGGSISGSPTLTNHGFQGFMYPPNLAGLAESPEDMKLPPSDLMPQLQDLEATLSPISDTTDGQNSSAMVSPLEFNKYPDNALPPISPRRSGAGHRHKGSAESISYTKEEDSGATRWVMERRRTGEYGQVEILEREVVEGGRI